MSSNMLASAQEALVGLPEEYLRLTKDFAHKLKSSEHEKWAMEWKPFLRQEPCWVKGATQVAQNPAAPAKEPIDSIVRVDRSVKPTYPNWMKKVMHPELENSGPAVYDASTLDQWFHEDQKSGVIGGNKLYEYIKKEKILESCVSLRDLEEIQRKGVVFFRKHFQGKAVFAWKSVVTYRLGRLFVPYACEGDGRVVVYWRWLVIAWNADDPALRFTQ